MVGETNESEALFREGKPVDSGRSTFELAFLPPHYSDLEKASFAYIYRIRGGFWLRVNFWRSVEGAGADEGMFLLQFKKGEYQLLAGGTAVHMY